MKYMVRKRYFERKHEVFHPLAIQLFNKLEALMNPRNVGPQNRPFVMYGGLVYRNGLSRKIWLNPSRYTQAGCRSYISDFSRYLGLWPWQTYQFTTKDLEKLERF